MDEHMGRRTVGGLLFTKGGSILLFREENLRRKTTSCCTRLGCSSKLFSDKDRRMPRQARETASPRRLDRPSSAFGFGKSNRKSPRGRAASESSSIPGLSGCTGTGNRPRRENPGRDLLSRLKERVNASRKSRSSSSSSSRSAGSLRTRKETEGGNAGSESVQRDHSRNARRRESEENDDFLFIERMTRDRLLPGDGFLSGNFSRHRSSLRGGPSLYSEDSFEHGNGYWRFDVEGSEEFEDYYMFNDRHRGMRMDIEDMSYEELLALGERIGTVSTGLSDEALSKCLKRSLYVPAPSTSDIVNREDGDVKCIICQEEYFDGEEVGKMACKHYYHLTCINQWLRQKNWCPICKAFASTC